MTVPQHRVHLVDRVQRLEAAAFALGVDVADIKAAVDQLPATIRQEILEYTEPVFGEIMAGNASLATKEHLDQVEGRLKEHLGQVEGRVEGLKEHLGQVEGRVEGLKEHLGQVEEGLKGLIDVRFGEVDGKLDQLLAALQKAPSR
ncbi:hypothetical protein GCM10022224_052550 [Nonomuraea antimicrobica]|uniref:Uncharacterized protein n=1 Tax=Nonomuraea antimicrobica TaxID=561173 RepID=A0ABP7CA19_9ACTN